MDDHEEQLAGGNVAADVVKVGNTVRKPVTAATASVEAFLRHLEAVEFAGAPRSLGRDPNDRYVVEYVPGVIAHTQPPLSLAQLNRVGRLIRALHDASETFQPPSNATWNVVVPPDREDLICHNDLAPWNLVMGDHRWVFIDWDSAAPSSRLWDFAYAAHGFVKFLPTGIPEDDAIRLAALVDGYGLDRFQRLVLPQMIVDRTRAMFNLLEHGARTGEQPWAALYADGHADHWGPTADYIEHHIAVWHAAITPA